MPFSAITIACTTARPKPVPPNSLFLDSSNLKKGLNKSSWNSVAMPGPSSSIFNIQFCDATSEEILSLPAFE